MGTSISENWRPQVSAIYKTCSTLSIKYAVDFGAPLCHLQAQQLNGSRAMAEVP